jgi:hypothetical protein
VLNNRKREERSGPLTWIEYERNSAGDVHLIRSGWHRWLGDFAEELIANKSFAELLRTSRSNEAGKEVGKDDSPGPKCSVKVTPAKDGKYKFVIKNAGGDNTVTFEVKVAE